MRGCARSSKGDNPGGFREACLLIYDEGDVYLQVIRGGIRRLRAFGVVAERLEVLEVKRLTEIHVEVKLASPWRLLVWEAPKR